MVEYRYLLPPASLHWALLMYCLILASFVACKGPSASEKHARTEEVVCGPLRQGDTLFVDGALPMLEGQDVLLGQMLNQSPAVVIAFINTDCSGCVLRLSAWQRFADSLGERAHVPFLLIASGNSLGAIAYRIREASFTHPVFPDLEQTFFTRNQLSYDQACHMYLIDASRVIRASGNPAEDKRYLRAYAQALAGGR